MALDKAIEHGKEKRKQYRGPKSYDSSCRNHGGCDYCKGNRLHSKNIREESAQEAIQEWYSMDGGRIFYAENRT